MGLSAGIVTKYKKEIILRDGDLEGFSKESDSLSRALNNIIIDPWIRLTGLTLVVEAEVEPDPNLNAEFWIRVATGDWDG